LGTLLGEEVVHVLDGIQKPAESTPIKSIFKTVLLPGKPKAESSSTDKTPLAPLNITVARVGAIAFVGLGGEVFNEIGRAIKAHAVATASELAQALVKLEPYFTPQEQFRDVSRGKPLPHSLSQDHKRKVGLTRETWRLEVLSDPEAPATLGHPMTQKNGTAL